jgi:RNA polymerase sigma-70 factor (ECF subfamily)
LQGRDQFAGACSERTWLISILKRKLIDHFRRQQREQPISDLAPDLWMDELFDQHGHWKKAPARWTSPSAAFENAEFWSTFSHCLGKLPRRLADAFSLREMDELASAEVCKVLAVSPTNLWVILHRARLRLWHCLDLHWFGGERGRR